MAERRGIAIALDGPVASGKGTLAPVLADKLHGFYLQTGAMYRCVALYCLENGFDSADEAVVVKALPGIVIAFHDRRVLLNDEDVTARIHEERVGMASSKVATMPMVRAEMVRRQQRIAEEYLQQGMAVIAEGRDTGTKLFPDADLKLFLTAAPEERAQRRLEQLHQSGRDAAFGTVLQELQARDRQDRERKTDPLVTEPEKHGYTVVDSTGMAEAQTIAKILAIVKEKHLV